MNENEILPKLVPRIYHTDEFVPFLEALDASFQYLEKSVKNLPDIVDVDNCDDKYLPYLAEGINCPLYGYNTKLWRKQIKNWLLNTIDHKNTEKQNYRQQKVH